MQKKAKSSYMNLPINVLLLTCTSKWLIEGILDKSYLEILGFGLAFGLQLLICIVGNKIRVNKKMLVVLIYLFSIVGNVVISGAQVSVVAKAFIQVFIFGFAMIMNVDKLDKDKLMGFIIKIGIFHSIMILIHFLLKEKFNSFYFPLLNPINFKYAQAYYRGGRFFGIHDSPHEVAGILTFAILSLIVGYINSDRKRTTKIALIVVLTFALLLIGKRGVLICGLISVILLLLVLYGSRKQWIRVIGIMLLVLVAYFGLSYYIMLHASNPLFYRLARLLNSVSDGSILQFSRFKLYERAIALWKNNPWLGIGWRQFKNQSVGIHDALAHEVNLDYLQWLCELGIIGFTLNVIFVVTMLIRTIHLCKFGLRSIADKDKRDITMFAIGVQFFTILYAFFEVPFYDIYFISIYAISCAAIVAASRWTQVEDGLMKGTYSMERWG